MIPFSPPRIDQKVIDEVCAALKVDGSQLALERNYSKRKLQNTVAAKQQ